MEGIVSLYWTLLALAIVHLIFWKGDSTLTERLTEEERKPGRKGRSWLASCIFPPANLLPGLTLEIHAYCGASRPPPPYRSVQRLGLQLFSNTSPEKWTNCFPSQFIRDNINPIKKILARKPFANPNRRSIRIFKTLQNVSLPIQVSYRNTFNISFTSVWLELLVGQSSFSSISQFDFSSSLDIRQSYVHQWGEGASRYSHRVQIRWVPPSCQ